MKKKVPQRYSQRFAGHEKEILRDIRLRGMVGAMMKWEARDYISWKKYIEEISGTFVEDESPCSDQRTTAMTVSSAWG